MRTLSECEEALFRAGKMAGEPAYSWDENKKNLRAEFEARFTLRDVGCLTILDKTQSADDLWTWIMENFVAKENK